MGGSSKQVVGHKYYASLVKFIGFRVEGIFAVNFDNRKWIWADPRFKKIGSRIEVNESDLYGESEGGVQGVIDLQVGTADQQPHPHYVAFDPEISGFPYQSYLVFRGSQDVVQEVETTNKWGQMLNKLVAKLGRHSFYHGNTNTMRDVLLWPSRIHVQNTDEVQWYDDTAMIGAISDYAAPIEYGLTEFHSGSLVTADMTIESLFAHGSPSWGAGTETIILRLREPAGEYRMLINLGLVSREGGFSFPQAGGDDPLISFKILSQDGFQNQLHEIKVLKPGVQEIIIDVNWGERKTSNLHWIFGGQIVEQESHPLTTDGEYGSGLDINPVHKIREILVNPSPWGMGKDAEDEINDENFRKAADRIYKEGLGVSWAIKDKDCIEAISELCHHIEAGVRVNRQTGKHEVVLFRDDWFEEDEIHTISESQIKSMQLEVQNADEVINHVNVKYYDRENIKDGAFSISENGLIKTVGQAISEDIEFPYFMQKYNAELVAGWKLKQLSTPVWKGTFTTGFREARKWNRYDLVDLPWSRKWQGTICVRIMAIKLGTATDNEVAIDFVEVVDFSNVRPSTGVDESYSTQAFEPQPSHATVFELPYYLGVYLNGQKALDDELAYDESIGYVAALAVPRQYNSINAAFYTDDAGANPDLEKAATVNYCEALKTDQAITKTMHSFTAKETEFVSSSRARRFAGATAGTLIKINDEFMSLESYDEATKVLTVKRGVLDTGVFDHPIDSTLFIFDTADIAVNQQSFIESDVVVSKVLTTTPSGIHKISDADAHTVEIEARAIRPYPPANIKINNAYWPAYIDGDLVISWSNRNRKTQTADTHLDWFDANSVPPENDESTLLVVTELDAHDVVLATYNTSATASNTWTLLKSNMDENTRKITIALKTVRDGFECLKSFQHSVLISDLVAPSNVTFEAVEY